MAQCSNPLTLQSEQSGGVGSILGLVRDTTSGILSDLRQESHTPVQALWSLRSIDLRVIAPHPFFVMKLRMPQNASLVPLISGPIRVSAFSGIRSIPNKVGPHYLSIMTCDATSPSPMHCESPFRPNLILGWSEILACLQRTLGDGGSFKW